MAVDKKQRNAMLENSKINDVLHSWVYDGLVLRVYHTATVANGQHVRIVECREGEEDMEFARLMWHRDSTIQELEQWGNAAADCRFPPAANEPDPEEPVQ